MDQLQNLCIRFIFGLPTSIEVVSDSHCIVTLLYKTYGSLLLNTYYGIFPGCRPLGVCVTLRDLDVPTYNTIFTAKSFGIQTTRLWNSIPENMPRNNPSLRVFKWVLNEWIYVNCMYNFHWNNKALVNCRDLSHPIIHVLFWIIQTPSPSERDGLGEWILICSDFLMQVRSMFVFVYVLCMFSNSFAQEK